MGVSPWDFLYVSQLVRHHSAIVLEPDKAYLIEARLTPMARAEGYGSIEAMIAELRRHPGSGLDRKVVEAMTTNETSFFRDLHPFEALRQVVIPEVLERRRAERRLTIWCAASASGQEPYSVAMTLLEHFPQLARWSVSILGTDISREMVARCEAGRYGLTEVSRGLSTDLLGKYFERQGMEWVARPELKRLCEFRELNLVDSWGAMPVADVVFLRNVLIYFDLTTKRGILENVRRVMQPWGYLFLGGAETTINLGDGYERVPFDRAGCYRLTRSEGRRAVS
ncbi:MAG TPA: protein-glutamate O-methyltransferase CheR [Gemmatimonadales bacterium]|nr:protein-glutamate O-methyltransferase CheR [Gemmatimonadales bacterium]